MSRRPPPPPAGKRRPAPPGAKKKKKKKSGDLTAQLVGGLTLLVLVGVVAAGGVYVAQRAMPEATPTPPPKGERRVTRPQVEDLQESQLPKRPGLALAMEDEIYAPRARDIGKDTPLDPPVNGLLQRGVLTVFKDGKFHPNEQVPRAEFLVWVYNAVMAQTAPGPDPFVSPKKGFPTVEPTGDEYRDLKADHWAAPVLAAVKASGIFDLVVEKDMHPDAPLTREEWAGFAAYIANAKEVYTKAAEEPDPTKFAVALRKLDYTDPTAVKPEFRGPLFLIASDEKRKNWILETFTQPPNPGPWGPNKPMTRAEVAIWLGSYYEQVGVGLM